MHSYDITVMHIGLLYLQQTMVCLDYQRTVSPTNILMLFKSLVIFSEFCSTLWPVYFSSVTMISQVYHSVVAIQYRNMLSLMKCRWKESLALVGRRRVLALTHTFTYSPLEQGLKGLTGPPGLPVSNSIPTCQPLLGLSCRKAWEFAASSRPCCEH